MKYKLLLLFFLGGVLFSQEVGLNPYSKEGVLRFADTLTVWQDYHRAAVEYLRFYALFRDDSRAEDALFRGAYSLERAKQYSDARRFYTLLELESKNYRGTARYRAALTYFLENNDAIAESIAVTFDRKNDPTTAFAMDYLRGFSLLRSRNYAAAESLFSALSKENRSKELSSSLSFLLSKSRQGLTLPHRSPFVAGALSTIVPGLGRGYCNRWGDALYSFVVIGATAAPAAYYWEKDRTFAITTGIAAVFFYFGNIYGSAVGADVFNEKQHNDFYNEAYEGVPRPPSVLLTGRNVGD